MATDELSLLFRLRGDASGLKTATAEARQASSQLQKSLGAELAQAARVGQKAFEDVGSRAEQLIRQQVPLGNVFVTVTQGFRDMAATASQTIPATQAVGLSLAEIGGIAHRTEAQVAGFIANLGSLATQAERNTATVGFLGAALASNLRPQLENAAKAGAELTRILEGSGKSLDEALKFVQALGLIGDSAQRNAAAVSFFGEVTAKKLIPQLERFGASIAQIAAVSGRSGREVTEFVAKFNRLGTEVEKNEAAIQFFGRALAQQLGPELQRAGDEIGAVEVRAASLATRLKGLVNPITIAAAALAAYGAIAAIVGKQLFDITKRTGALEGKLADLSQQTGIAVETLSALEIIAKQNGLEIGSLVNSLNQFQRRLEEARDPTSRMAERLRLLGVEATESEGALRQALAGLFALGEGSNQTAQALELFGQRGGRAILAVLKQVNGDLDLAIEQFREMGILVSTDAARAADQFNDELEILNRQIEALTREMGRELLPVMVDLVKTFAEFFRTVRPIAAVLGKTAVFAVQGFTDALKTLRLTIAAVTLDYKELQRIVEESRDALRIPEIQVAAPAPVPLPAPQTDLGRARDAIAETEAVLDAVRRAVAEGNQKIEQEYEKGRVSRDTQVFEIIRRNNDLLKAERAHIDARIIEKERELKELQSRGESETEAFRKSADEIVKLQQELADAESETRVKNSALRFGLAKKNAEDLRKQEAETTQLILAELDKQIEAVRSRVQSEIGFEREGLELIEQLELAKVDARKESLERQRDLEFLTLDAIKEIDNEIRRINQERDVLIAEQERARLQRARAESQTRIEILEAELDTILRIGVIHDEARIASIRSLADLQLQTEEATAREILRIRLDAIKREEEVIRARLQTRDADVERVAAPIRGRIEELEQVKERNREEEAELERLRRRLREINQARIVDQTELNNQLRILKAEEQAIEAEGNRAIDDGRQRDLEDRKQHVEEVSRIQRRIADIERDTAKEILDQMVLGFASRKQIVRAQAELEIRRANERHRRNQEDIRRDKDEVAERLAGLQGFLRAVELSGKRELTVYQDAIKARVAALNQQKDLNQHEREELAQHQRILSGIRTQTDIQDYAKAIRARVEALERQTELNEQEQAELAQHHAILQSLREREEQSIRAGTLQARIEILERQVTLNEEEEAELQRHYAELAEIRGSEDLTGVIEQRIAVLSQQGQLNAREQRELEQHQRTLDQIRGRGGVEIYAREIQARIDALRQQRELNEREQAELQSHLQVLEAIRAQREREQRRIQLTGRIEQLRRQKELNAEEQRELESHQAELIRIRAEDDFTVAITRRVQFLRQQQELNQAEQEELKRHEAVLRSIRAGGADFTAAIRARIAFLESQEGLNAAEQEELKRHRQVIGQLENRSQIYEDATQRRIEFLEKQKELNAEERAELEAHKAAIETIQRRTRLEEKDADPIGRLTLDTDNLKEFASVIENTIVPLGQILTSTFLQVADAIGQTVANWVLLGETGPAVMRKMLAQALASIAAEAAVNAIKELALGFATLFFNPAESAAHFKAAALWTAAAVAAGAAGRGVAGNLFRPTAGGGAQGASTRPQELNPITLNRNQPQPQQTIVQQPQPQRVIVQIGVKDSEFGKAISAHVVKDITGAGPIREVIANDGAF